MNRSSDHPSPRRNHSPCPRLGRMFNIVLCACSLAGAPLAPGDDPGAPRPLATKQQIIRDRVSRLEDRMYRLIEELEDQEPKRAQRLETALARMGELGVRHKLRKIVETLDDDRLETAVGEQSELLDSLAALLTVLIKDPDDAEARRKEIERLEQFKERLNTLINEEYRLEEQSAAAAEAMAGFQPDAAAAQAIEQLLGEQRALHSDTQDKYNKQPQAKSRQELQDRQQALADEAEKLAKMLGQKQEAQAAKQTRSAELDMKDATAEISGQAYGAAGDAQEDAMEDLERALAKLTKRPPPETQKPDFDKLADEQSETGRKTADLAQQMRENPQNPSELTPGQENVEMSKQHMDAAEQKLRGQNPSTADPGAARRDQQQAIQQLAEAKAKVQREIDQLKREQQEKKLAALEDRFKDMLAKQQAINRRTIELDDIPRREWKRREQLRAVEHSERQRQLGESAEEALDILTEDGTTTVLPQLVEFLRDDMFAVAQRLGDSKVGAVTQAAQSDIVATIESILDVIEQNRTSSSPNSNSDQQQAASGDPPLLPPSAELKLLSDLQERVFRQTKTYHRASAARSTRRAADQDTQRLGRITRRQTNVARMATEMNNKLRSGRRPPPQRPPTNDQD